MKPQQITIDVLAEKYLKGNETTAEELYLRVANGIAQAEKTPELVEKWSALFLQNMRNGAIGAGRIMAAAGTDIKATLANCFVQPVGDCFQGFDEDGLPGIYDALRQAGETMRRGGGVGYNFSAIRPKGALVKGTMSEASGPCSFMDVFDIACKTVESAGSRRGAQMGILAIDHPDVMEFVQAKRTKGRWNNFNVSIGVTEAFMLALENDQDWQLVHKAEPHQPLLKSGCELREDGKWVYKTMKASEMWDVVMQSTYDFAEPGIVFLDTMNRDNNLHYCEKLAATNPCVTGDTWVFTKEGSKQVTSLLNTPVTLIVDGNEYASNGFFSTGVKQTFNLKTKEGYSLKLTGDHKVCKVTKITRDIRETEWIEAEKLVLGDKIVINNHTENRSWGGLGNEDEGYLLGVLKGDGHIKKDTAVISVWPVEDANVGIMNACEIAFKKLFTLRSDFSGFFEVKGRGEYRIKTPALKALAEKFGMTQQDKAVTNDIKAASSDFQRGFIRGFFDADGSVQGNQEKGVSVRLTQINLADIHSVQRMLCNFGIASCVYENRKGDEPVSKLMPDGRGGQKLYETQLVHELVISGENINVFADRIGFADTIKNEKLNSILANYKRQLNRERFVVTVSSFEASAMEEVFDVQVPGLNAFDANGLYVHNCGEQPLPAYGCCDLGPIILPKFVKNAFTKEAFFDFSAFADAIETQVRFLDNVLDVTYWPLEEQRIEAQGKRRVGLGFTGLGNALTMLGKIYNSKYGRDFAKDISEFMRNNAYNASVELAKEKGAFPLFNADEYLKAGTFASRLPLEIQANIRLYGIRNSHLLSIAPTGTVSLAFADNASNGIEPAFSLSYSRKKRLAGGGESYYAVLDHAFRVFLETICTEELRQPLLDAVCAYKTEFKVGDKVFVVKDVLPSSFVNALEMSADDHLAMLEVVQPFIDSAISKTVNIPADYPFEEFKGIYVRAWKAGLKGLATYRPNETLGSVLSVGAPVAEVKVEATQKVADIDPLKIVFEKRPEGDFEAVNSRMEYISDSTGSRSLYLSLSFAKVKGVIDGHDVEIERPLEIFIPSSQSDVPQEWVSSFSRQLSLNARSGFLAKSLQDARQIKSDRGRVRFGFYEKEDGTKVPRFHDSEVGAIAYAIQRILFKRGFLDVDGNQVPARKLAKFVSDVSQEHAKAATEVSVDEKKPSAKVQHGKKCKECNAHAVVKRDGCDFCENCGALGSCG